MSNLLVLPHTLNKLFDLKNLSFLQFNTFSSVISLIVHFNHSLLTYCIYIILPDVLFIILFLLLIFSLSAILLG